MEPLRTRRLYAGLDPSIAFGRPSAGRYGSHRILDEMVATLPKSHYNRASVSVRTCPGRDEPEKHQMYRSVRGSARRRSIVHFALLSVLLVALVASFGAQPAKIAAQDATPVATATPGCEPRALVAAPSVPASIGTATNGTPSPVVDVDQQTADEITALVDSLAACLTNGDFAGVAELVTDRYLGDAYAGGERLTKEDYLALAPSAPRVPVRVVSVDEIRFASSDTATATVVTVQGNQLRSEEWTFLFRRNRQPVATPSAAASGEGHWLVHQVAVQSPTAPQDAATMKAVQSDYAIQLTPNRVTGPDLVVTVQNTGKETHEFLTLKLGSGASIDQLIRPTSDQFPSNIQVIGQETIPAGETRTLVFVDLEPGTYTVVCLLPDADGVPHLAFGETATFTVS